MADPSEPNPSGSPDDPQGPREETPLPEAHGDLPADDDFSEKLQQGGHVVICNWNTKGEAIVRELHSGVVRDKRLVVVVTDKKLPKRIGEMWRGVFGVDGDPLEREFLLQAMITKAHSAIILADEESPNPDTTNFMLAASIERINPNVHTIVEISESSYLEHFQGTGVDEMICVNEIAEKIISQSCLTPGLSELYLRLLTASEETNEIYILPAPEATHGHTYRAVRRAIGTFEGESLVLLGFLAHVDDAREALSSHRTFERNGKRMTMIINPVQGSRDGDPFSQDYVIRPCDELILMAYEEPGFRGFRVESEPSA